jgi:PPOX class probable F420-dependent enzyme
MQLTAHLPPERRERVESRLRNNIIAWLTTVGASGRPDTVPVWYLVNDDETILLYSEPGKAKLRNIDHNPKISLVLDVTDLGRDVIRLDGTAALLHDWPPADEIAPYVTKYTERIAPLFGTAANFAASFSVPMLITPTRLRA